MAKRYDPFKSKMTSTRRTVSWGDRRSADPGMRKYRPAKVKISAPKVRTYSNYSSSAKRSNPTSSEPGLFETIGTLIAKKREKQLAAQREQKEQEELVEYNKKLEESGYYDQAAKELQHEKQAADISQKEMRCLKENGCRYYLCTQDCRKPLFIIGVNPSTADEQKDDPTVRKMKTIAKANGFDGVVILNVYPLICTDPNKLPEAAEAKIINGNHAIWDGEIQYFQKNSQKSDDFITVWCAWGDLVEKRSYLKAEAEKIFKSFPEETKFVCIGKTKKGNPKHPLYASGKSKLTEM